MTEGLRHIARTNKERNSTNITGFSTNTLFTLRRMIVIRRKALAREANTLQCDENWIIIWLAPLFREDLPPLHKRGSFADSTETKRVYQTLDFLQSFFYLTAVCNVLLLRILRLITSSLLLLWWIVVVYSQSVETMNIVWNIYFQLFNILLQIFISMSVV